MGAHLVSSPSQHQKRGLKRILCEMQVARHSAADSKDQRTVALHQGSERMLVVMHDKAIEEPVIGWRYAGMIRRSMRAQRSNDGR